MSPGVRVLLGLLLVLPACSLPEEPAADQSPVPLVKGCQRVEPGLKGSIEGSLRRNRSLGPASAVQTPQPTDGPLGLRPVAEGAWFIAAEIDGAGAVGPGDVGLWITDDDPRLEGDPGLVFGVNDEARELGILGIDVSLEDLEVDGSEPQAQEAIECVRGA